MLVCSLAMCSYCHCDLGTQMPGSVWEKSPLKSPLYMSAAGQEAERHSSVLHCSFARCRLSCGGEKKGQGEEVPNCEPLCNVL